MRQRRSLPTPKELRSTRRVSAPALGSAEFRQHPLYGKIPLIPSTHLTAEGRMYTFHEYDPNYAPDMPRGAVRGNIRQQNLCFHCNVPKYFYVDEQKTCIQCGQAFIFSAREQKFWYETLKFYGTSQAIRCPQCRRKKRSEKNLCAQIGSTKSALKQDQDNPALLLGLSEAIVRYHAVSGQANLTEAIAAARRARKLVSKAFEAFFWEALCHIQGGRGAKGRELLARFIESPLNSKKQRDLVKEARQHLVE